MLSSTHFFHHLTRKYITIFGNIFNDITLVQYNREDLSEVKRVKVPLVFGPKEKWVTRQFSDPDLVKKLQITLPRITYEVTGYMRDPSRQQISYLPSAVKKSATQYKEVPYDITFNLSIYTRNLDDGHQIVEQILPYFNPQYSVTATLIPELNLTKDIPIILNDVQEMIEYEGGDDSTRVIQWVLSFTMKVWYFGPVYNAGLIRTSIANIWADPSLITGYVSKVNVTDPNDNNGDYPLSDVVYQGDSFELATAIAKVLNWDKDKKLLYLGDVQGTLKVNTSIISTSSNANYTLESFDTKPLKYAEIVTVPDPLDAEPGDDFGYNTTLKEYPDTMD